MSIESIKLNQEPAVFVIARDSQYKGISSEGKYYTSTLSLIDKMLVNNNLESEIVGFSGTKKDLAVFLATFFAALEFHNTEFSIQRENTDDFNPDIPVRDDNDMS